MNSIAFIPIVDLPLVAFATIAFVLNFRYWCFSANEDLQPYLKHRLFRATLRVFGFFAVLLLLCWLLDFPVWVLFALTVVVGLPHAIIGGNPNGFGLGLSLACGLLREWCFDFPQLVLRPEPDSTHSEQIEKTEQLIGRVGTTTSILRPAGLVMIDGDEFPAASEGGVWIESEREVKVVAAKNGTVYVEDIQG